MKTYIKIIGILERETSIKKKIIMLIENWEIKHRNPNLKEYKINISQKYNMKKYEKIITKLERETKIIINT